MKDTIKRLRTELATLTNQAKTLYAELETKGDQATADERTKLNTLIDEGTKKRTELTRLEELDANDQAASSEPAGRKTRETPGDRAARTWGEAVTQSEQFKAASPRWTEGKMERVPVNGGIKALYGATDAAGGYLVEPRREPEPLDLVRMRPFTIVDLLNVVQVTTDAIEYFILSTRTNNAAVVPEYTGGNFGLKPESNIAFAAATATIKTIPTWVAASRQILADAPQLRDTIDTELEYMVRFVLENQVLAGDGTGNNFTGILNTSGIQARVMHASSPTGRGQVTGDTRMTTLRRANTDIALEFYEATAVVMNPADTESLEITEYTGNRFSTAFDPVTMRVWRVPVVESNAMPALTALVGNFRMAATLYDRQQVEIRVGEPNDFFLRNAVAILAELRAGLAIKRPKAIEKVTLI